MPWWTSAGQWSVEEFLGYLQGNRPLPNRGSLLLVIQDGEWEIGKVYAVSETLRVGCARRLQP